ncbi:hypothetical protein D3C76_1525300 [compost metagenome]
MLASSTCWAGNASVCPRSSSSEARPSWGWRTMNTQLCPPKEWVKERNSRRSGESLRVVLMSAWALLSSARLWAMDVEGV